MHFGETLGSICSVALRSGRVLLLLLRLFRTSQDRRRRSISRFRYLICASMTAAPVISGAAPCGAVDSQLCTQTPSMFNTNGNLLSDRASLHPSLHFKTTLVIFSSFTIHCQYGLCASLSVCVCGGVYILNNRKGEDFSQSALPLNAETARQRRGQLPLCQ